jgi:hypothetical protein
MAAGEQKLLAGGDCSFRKRLLGEWKNLQPTLSSGTGIMIERCKLYLSLLE